MTPAASLLDPDSNPALYVAAVLTLYVDLPDTPLRASAQDQRQARSWFDRGVALEVVETALLLACLRRMAAALRRAAPAANPFPGLLPTRHRGTPGTSRSRRLSPIPAPQAPQHRRQPRVRPKVQKSTFSDDR